MLPNERRVVLIAMAVGGLVGDFLLPFVIVQIAESTQSVLLVSLPIGFVSAQMGVVSAWCAMANQAILIRVPVTFAMFVVGVCLFLLGMRAVDGVDSLEDVVFLAMQGLIMFAAMQIPLWLIRLFGHRRIGVMTDDRPETNDGKLSIRYLMLATAAVAGIIALIQAAIPADRFGGVIPMWGFVLLVISTFAIFSASITVPCLWLVLSDSDSARSSSAIALFLAWGGGPMVIMVILSAVMGGRNGMPAEVIGGIYAFGAGACGAMVASLLLLRGIGYRLLKQAHDGTLSIVGDENVSADRETESTHSG